MWCNEIADGKEGGPSAFVKELFVRLASGVGTVAHSMMNPFVLPKVWPWSAWTAQLSLNVQE